MANEFLVKVRECIKRYMLKVREGIKRYIFRPLLLGVGKLISPFSTVGNPPVFSNSTFPYTSVLEENWPAIKQELDQILLYNHELPNLQDLQHEQISITN